VLPDDHLHLPHKRLATGAMELAASAAGRDGLRERATLGMST
jgi:hypothetical protein